MLRNKPPGQSSSPTIPAAVPRKAPPLGPAPEEPHPTTTDPSADVAYARLRTVPPGKSPRPTTPVAAVQRNASTLEPAKRVPITTDPSADTARSGRTKPN